MTKTNSCICGSSESIDKLKKPKKKVCKPANCCNVFNKKGSDDIPTLLRSDKEYLTHKEALPNIKPKIDAKPPRLYLHSVFRSQKIKDDYQRVSQINKQNLTLLKNINIIYRTRGEINTYNPLAGIRLSHLKLLRESLEKYEYQNLLLLHRIENTRAHLRNDEMEKSWQLNIKRIRLMAKKPLILPGLRESNYDPGVPQGDCMDKYRPKVFFEIAANNGRTIGCISILLYSDVVPETAQNFLDLIMNYKKSKPKRKLDHFVQTPIYRVFKNLYAETGDITKGNGTGGRSARGTDFKAENYTLPVEHTGSVAMVVDENGMVNSKFIITFKPISLLNGTCVVIGRVIKGINVLEAIEASARQNGVPREELVISNNGILRPMSKFPRQCKCVSYGQIESKEEVVCEIEKNQETEKVCQKWRCPCKFYC